MRRLALVLVACPLAACMVGPNYRRPAVDVPPAYRYEAAEARDTANAAWWQQFQDPVLDQLIADVLAHNLSVQIAAANVEQAAAALTQAKATLYPQASCGVKILFWEEGGYWLCARRLEAGTFRWPQQPGACARYRREELLLLLGGIDLKQTQERKWYRREAEKK